MEVFIIATKNCSHCPNMSKELTALGISHAIHYAEENPDLCKKYSIRHSPNLVVDEAVVFRKQPSDVELRDYFNS